MGNLQMDNPIFNQELRCFFSWLFFVLIFVMKGKIMTFSYNFDDDILEHQRLVDADNELELKRLLRKYGSLEGIEKNADIRDSMAYMMANQNGLVQKVLTQETGNSLLSSQGTQYAKNDRANYTSDATEVTGNLSAEHESGSRPYALGHDNGGGYSYGLYQIETKHGTMLDYIKYINKLPQYNHFAKTLIDAGGYEGAYSGSERFKAAWKSLSQDELFNQSQRQFILDKKLQSVINFTKKIKGFNVEKRHPIIKEVLYSLATQHGNKGAPFLLQNALGNDVSYLDDAAIINKIYDERSKVDKYFKNISKKERENIKNRRFPSERQNALRALQK